MIERVLSSLRRNGLLRTGRLAGQELRQLSYYPLAHLYLCLPITYSHSVAGNTARFEISEIQEYHRIVGLYGGKRPNLPELIGAVRPDDTFYEVGANIGVYSCLVGRSLTDGTVVAFEPFPQNVRRLETHLEGNGINHIVRAEALFSERGSTELHVDGDGAGSGLHSLGQKDGTDVLTVPMETIDSLVERGEIPPPTVIQMDAEGVEYEVLRGAKETLSRDDCRLIHVQVHVAVKDGNQLSDHGSEVTEIVDLLEECGFSTTFRDASRTNGYLIATKDRGS